MNLKLKMPLHKTLKKIPPYIAWVLLALFIIGAYAPLILKGGIIADDWGDIAQNLICNGFFECYRSWFPLFSNRPLAPLPITISTLLFGLNIGWYLVLNTLIYLLAVFITAYSVRRLFTAFAKIVFISLATVPVIAMPIVVSPINQSTATLAFLFWAISLLLIQSYCHKRSFIKYGSAYLFLLASLLTYEVMLPLLVLTAFLPFAINSETQTKNPIRYFFKFAAPIILILGLVLFWQKVLAVSIFSTVYSRLAFDPNNVGLLFLNWLNIFSTSLPQLLFKSLRRVDLYAYLISSFLAITLIFFWAKQSAIQSNNQSGQNRSLITFFIVFLCFIASSSIFILSGSIAEVGGNDARALSSTWICFALLIASLFNFFSKKIIAILLALLLICLSYIAFGVQRDNYIRSWQLQTEILRDVLGRINSENVSAGATIIGNVPGYLPNNFNNEIVFTQPWDFGAALSLYTNKKIAGGAVLDTRASNFSKPLRISDGILSIDQWWKTDTANLWFYDYDPNVKSGTLRKIPNVDSLMKLFVSLGYLGEFESKSYVTTNSPILFAKDWLDRSKYVISGWGERESWGGIWSTQDRATIRLPIPENSAKSITFNTNAFVSSTHPKQEVLVSINGHPQGKAILEKFEENTFSIPLPKIDNRAMPITIDFQFPNAKSPKSLGLGDDDRKLGIGLKTATFN